MPRKESKIRNIVKSDKELIEQAVNDLKKIRHVIAVILFGSYARGEQKPISDIDICAVTQKNIPYRVKADIGSHASRKIQISLFWDMPPAVRYAALREGRILFNRDNEFLHTATVETMSEYLDFKRIIDRHCNAIFGVENE